MPNPIVNRRVVLPRRLSGTWMPTQLANLYLTLIPSLSFQAGKLWQDTARTTPVTTPTQSVGAAQCTFTGNIWTASTANLPTLQTSSGKFYLSSPGSVSFRLTTTLGLTTSSSAGWYVGASAQQNGTDSSSALFDHRNSGSGTPIFNIATGWTVANGRVSGLATTSPGGTTGPIAWTTHEAIWNGATLTYARGGTAIGTAAFSGTLSLNEAGVLDNFAGGASANGLLAGIIFASANQSAAGITLARTYLTSLHP